MASGSCDDGDVSAAGLVLRAALMVPAAQYLLAALLVLVVFFYNVLEFHFLRDLLRGFRGDPVVLTFNPASKIYEGVASKCWILHGRYSPTLWLASPHLQTAFLHLFGRPPSVTYRRQLFSTRDGGTIALDWLLASDVVGGSFDTAKAITKDDTVPIVIVVPGLTSDSASPYAKHLTYGIAKHGWNVVVSNHRGLAGISITSDCFYNAGWTEDIREVVNYLHQEYPKACLFAVGTSVGANILVKYLGEDKDNTPVAGAVSICSPWDILICDRFLNRKPVQRFYNKALTVGLKDYAALHQPVLTRLANWEGIIKSCFVREFDDHATRLVGKFETVDTFYRCSSSVNFIGNVAVPLLCISALDDPLCTREAIPWDECRANQNIILATTAHGGHLAYFKGLTAQSLWWVEVVREFLGVLHASPHMHRQKKALDRHGDGMMAAITNEGPPHDDHTDQSMRSSGEIVLKDDIGDRNDVDTGVKPTDDDVASRQEINEMAAITHEGPPHDDHTDLSLSSSGEIVHKDDSGDRNDVDTGVKPTDDDDASRQEINEMASQLKSSIKQQLSRYRRTSMGLLICIAIATTWPVLYSIYRKKLRSFKPG